MDRELIAEELLKVAKDLTGAGDIDLGSEYKNIYKSIANTLLNAVKGINGVDKAEMRMKERSNGLWFTINATGYTRSDFEAEANVTLDFDPNTNKHFAMVGGLRPDWGEFETELLDQSFGMRVPLNKIIRNTAQIFG